jgi:hypothetical protein
MNVRGFFLVLAVASGVMGQTALTPMPTAKPAVVAELFTSEGCSSCPPADALLTKMDGMNYQGTPIIVLSEHVDYWNHDGWHDPFSSEQWTARQNGYNNERFHLDSVYTPQMVIDGTQQVNGSNGPQIAHAIETAAAQAGKLQIEITDVTWDNDVLHATVSVPDLSAQAKGTTLYAVLADDEDTSSVAKGENSGKTLKHVSVLRVMQKVSSLHGPYSGPVQIKLPRGVPHSKMRLIVFAQKGQNGQIFGAAQREV